jgi:A/G-specific adenine glycosylase
MSTAAAAPESPPVASVHTHLLEWYAAQARDLPWRRTRDPYAILVAEVMLQQTQVDRVIPKWHTWLTQFASIAALAQASRADAIRAWQGLGYNVRAVRLHGIACQVVAEHGGVLPRSVEGLLGLKGIGRYTAGAVACFAYGQPVAMVDTNVRRVLSRVFGVQPGAVEALADSVLPPGAQYAWNQALMDLGATLCRARQPLCLVCPLLAECPGPWPPDEEPRSKPPVEFRGSTRFYRGRLVNALRGLEPGESMLIAELVLAVSAGHDDERVAGLLRQLAVEGLVSLDAERAWLPD